MNTINIILGSGDIYTVPGCLIYWLAMETALPQIDCVFDLLATNIPARNRIEVWTTARIAHVKP